MAQPATPQGVFDLAAQVQNAASARAQAQLNQAAAPLLTLIAAQPGVATLHGRPLADLVAEIKALLLPGLQQQILTQKLQQIQTAINGVM